MFMGFFCLFSYLSHEECLLFIFHQVYEKLFKRFLQNLVEGRAKEEPIKFPLPQLTLLELTIHHHHLQ